MYKVTVPFLVTAKQERQDELCSDTMLKVFQKLKAERIALVFQEWNNYEQNSVIVKNAIAHFAKYNMEVAVWLNSLLHIAHGEGFTKKKYKNGKENFACPFDEKFQAHFANYVASYAKTGVKLVYLDDDFRISASGGINCFCDLHMQRYKKLLGENITAEKMLEELLTGKPSVYREAWSKVNADALKTLAKAIRAEVDKIDPSIRIGLCASPATMFGVDGNAFELSEILAGNTKPFLRTVGAPYWCYWAQDYWKARMNDIIGMQRLEGYYAEENGYCGEVITEGDTFPRPRYTAPASYLELFHSALAVENRLDGILKYTGEYTRKASYERGYSRLAAENAEKIQKITDAFENTSKVGYRIFEVQNKMPIMEFKGEDVEFLEHGGGIPASIRALNDASIPYTFSGNEPIVAFGDNVRRLTEKDLEQGLVTDIIGVQILQEKGFDLGLISLEKECEAVEIGEEYPMYDDAEYVDFKRSTELFKLNLKSNAEVLTYTMSGTEKLPLTYRYAGKDFKAFVCCVDVTYSRYAHGYFKSYSKQRLLAENYQWLKGEDLPAMCFDCPMVMPIVGKKENQLVIGLWNIFEDRIFDQEIKLFEEYTQAEFIGCSGSLNNGKLILDNLNPFDFCAIVLTK